MSRLTYLTVKNATKPGRHSDGDTLYLYVAPGGSKSWIQRITVAGRRCEIGLGGWPGTTLAQAREKAMDNRRIVRNGGDPLAEKHKVRIPVFQDAARSAYATYSVDWSPGHAKAWLRSLEKFVFPRLGNRQVDRIAQSDVLALLNALRKRHPSTARRMRWRLRQVFDWCLSYDFVTVNVAGDVIKAGLPPRRPAEQNFRAVPHTEVSEVYELIQSAGGAPHPRLCLLFTILLAARGKEAREAKWEHIDLDTGTWTIPELGTKSRIVYTQPLSDPALAVLSQSRLLCDGSPFVFPAARSAHKCFNQVVLRGVLERCGLVERTTVHGFRATFRTWADECTDARVDVKELSLGHVVGTPISDPYGRSDLLELRRPLFELWGRYVTAGSVAPRPSRAVVSHD